MEPKLFLAEPSVYRPSDYGFKAWAYDLALAPNSFTPTLGVAFVTRLRVDKVMVITNILLISTSSASGLTGAYSAIYQVNSGGNNALLAQTADVKASFSAAGGKTLPLSAPVTVKKGYVDVVTWFVGGTPPNIARASQLSGVGDFLTGINRRFAAADTGLTTTAPSTLGTKTALGSTPWAAIN